jgi:response regulator RpfG family c-di-GMP phosphodiesterase
MGSAQMLSITDIRILIVDDSDTTRRILGNIVRSRDWTVCGEAEDGWSGVKKFQELRPDLVLLDLSMPDIDGLESRANDIRLRSNSADNSFHGGRCRRPRKCRSTCRYLCRRSKNAELESRQDYRERNHQVDPVKAARVQFDRSLWG